MGRFVQVPYRLMGAAIDLCKGRVPLLLLPRKRVEPQCAGLSGEGEEGMTDGAQQGRNGSGNKQRVYCCPVRNQFVQGYPVCTQWRRAACLQRGGDLEQRSIALWGSVSCARSCAMLLFLGRGASQTDTPFAMQDTRATRQ